MSNTKNDITGKTDDKDNICQQSKWDIFLQRCKGWSKNRFKILLSVLALALVVAGRDLIANTLNKIWVLPFMMPAYEHHFVYLLGIGVAIGVYYFLSYIIEREVSASRRKLLLTVTSTVALAYIYSCFEVGKGWNFAPGLLGVFAVAWIGELAVFIKYRNRRKKTQKEEKKKEDDEIAQGLILDHPLEESGNDQYKRHNYSEIVTERLNNNFHKEGAFVTGLSGNWGYGKTSFLNMMREDIKKLKEKGSKTSCNIDIQFDFEPWRSSSPDAIIGDFMNQLAEEVEPYVPLIRRKFIKYADSITSLDTTSYIGNVVKAIRYSIDESPEKQYRELSETLLKSELNILVFIDDTDRLEPDEIVEVFKLVRNSANFPYMQFVVTYDRDYIIESLQHSKHKITNADRYIEKIFNVELALPGFESEVIFEALDEMLQDKLQLEKRHSEQLKYNAKVYSDFPLEEIIKTKRDVIRFVNSFVVNINAFAASDNKGNAEHQIQTNLNLALDDIVLSDLYKLELTRYKYPDLYQQLMYSANDFITYYQGKESFVSHFIATIKKVPSKEERGFANCINSLFPNNSPNNKNSITKRRAFNQYFRYRYDEKNISSADRLVLLEENDETSLKDIIIEYYKTKKEGEVRNMFRFFAERININSFSHKNKDQLFYYKKPLKVINSALKIDNENIIKDVAIGISPLWGLLEQLEIDHYLEVISIWDKVIGMHEGNDKAIFINLITRTPSSDEDKIKIKEFLYSVESIEFFSNLIAQYIHPENKSPDLIFDKQELNKILVHYFMKHAENGKVNETTGHLFINCADKKPSNEDFSWEENNDVVERFRELINEDKQGYITRFWVIYKNKLVIHSFWKPLFNENINEVEKYLYNKDKNKLDRIDKARKAWELSKLNNFELFDVSHLKKENSNKTDEEEKEENDAIIDKLYQELEYAKDVESKIENQNTTTDVELSAIYKRLKSSPLQILYTNKLLSKIDIPEKEADDLPY